MDLGPDTLAIDAFYPRAGVQSGHCQHDPGSLTHIAASLSVIASTVYHDVIGRFAG
ncbi:hypothetical protein OFB51_24950 [Escherichia coli]|nr:hypothetical protein [Escherichia coli]